MAKEIFSKHSTRALVALSMTAALLGGFFIPATASALTTLTVTSPNGAEFYRGTRNITWSSTGGVSGDTVNIVYSTDAFSSQALIQSGLPYAPGTYAWNTTGFSNGSTYLIRFIDGSNFVYDTSNAVFTVDNTAPATSITIPAATGLAGWYTTAPSISLSCNDGTGSGCHSTYYSWDGVATTTGTGPFIAPEGVHTLMYYSDDNATDQFGVRNIETLHTLPVKVDAIAPTLGITLSDTALKIGDTSLVTFTFSEPVTGFDNSDITTIDSGTLTPVSSSDGGTTWTATFTPSAATEDATNLITVNKTGVIDVAGNAGVGTQDSPNYTVDTIRPTLGIALSDTALKIGDTSLITFTFSESETGFDASDVTTPNGTIGAITGGPLIYTATFTPNASVESATNVVTVNTNWTDTAGNAPAASTNSANYAIDTRAPTAAITYSDTDALVKSGDSLTITATFSEPLLDAPVVKIALSGANTLAATNMTKVDSTHYTYVHTVGAGNGTVTVALSVGTDAAGNVVTPAPTSGATFTVDNTPPIIPTITSIAGDNYINNAEKAAVVVTGSAEANAFVSVTLADAHAHSVSGTQQLSGGATTYSITLNASGLLDETITPSVTATDAAGNTSSAATTPTATKDTVAPTVASITTKDANHDGSVETATIVFSEAVKDSSFGTGSAFSIGGVAGTGVNSGTANDNTLDIVNGGVAGTDVKDVLYTPGSATDLAGNPLASISSGTVTEVDGAGPVLMSARTTDVTHITAKFSEDLLGSTVTGSDFSVTIPSHVVASATEGPDDGTVFIVLSSPMTTGETPTVNYIGSIKDNHTNVGPNGSVVAVDGIPPTLSLVHIVSNNATPTLAKSGDVVTLTFTSSETIAPPTVLIQGIAATSITNPSGNNWVATRTMTGTDTEGPVTFSIAFQDVVVPANVGTTVTAVSDASSVLFDRTAPSVGAGTDKEVNALSAQDATISDAGSGIATYTWSKVSGSGTITFSNPSGSGPASNPDTNISASADDAYDLRLTVTDAAGNSASDDLNFIWDTFAPRLEYTVPNNNATNVPVAAGTMHAYFRVVNHGSFAENITLLDASKVLIEDTAGNDAQTSVAVQGGNGTSRILDVGYGTLTYGKTYCLTILAGAVRDTAGNVTTQDITGNCFTTTIDTMSPVVNSFTAGAVTTSGATLTVITDESSTCRYATTDSAYSSMGAFDAPNTGTSHTAVLTGLTPSTLYNYYVRCADTSPQINTMTTSAHVQFTTSALVVDTTPPVITSISLDKPAYHVTTDPTVVATVTTDGTESTLTTNAPGAVVSGAPGSWTITFAHGQTVPGTYSFNVVATDSSSNANTQIVQYDVVADDAVVPVIAITAPAAGATVSGSTVFTFTTNGAGTTAAQVSIDGGSWFDATTNANPGTYATSTTAFSDGSHTIRVRDTVASVVGYSDYLTFIINNTPVDNTPPTIASTNPADASTGVAVSATPQIVFSEALNPATVINTSVQLLTAANAPVVANVTLANGNQTVVITPTNPLDYGMVYHLSVASTLTDAAGNAFAGNTHAATFTTQSEPVAALAVTGISAVANANGSTGFSTPDNTFDNGWRWTFHVTVPTTETQFAMKFSDFTSGANVLSAANDIRYYTAQSSAHAASTTAVTIAGANAYPATITLDGTDLDPATPGRQIDVTVEAKVPSATPAGSYSTSYGVESL